VRAAQSSTFAVPAFHEELAVRVAPALGPVQVLIGVPPILPGADVPDAHRDVEGNPPFEHHVELVRPRALDVVGIGRAHGDVAGHRDPARADVGQRDLGDAELQRERREVAAELPGGRFREPDRQRIESTERARPRERVVGDAVAGPEHRFLVQAVGDAHPRREERLAGVQADVLGHAAHAAEEHFVRRVVEPLQAATASPLHDRVVLVAQPEVDGELFARIPSVADEEGVLVLPARHLLELDALAVAARASEEEAGVLVPEVRGVARLARDVPREVEGAARTAAELRLPVIELIPDEVEAGAEFVRPGELREVRRDRVAPLEALHRVPRRRVPYGAHAGIEPRHAALARIRAVGPGIPSTSLPKRVPKSPPWATWFCQFIPTLPSRSIVGLSVQV
jgi:hypothetical protein